MLGIGFLLIACQAQSSMPVSVGELVFRNWADDMPEDLFADYSAKTGIQVVYKPYESQEEVISAIENGEVADLVVLDSRFIAGMVERGLLKPIDRSRVPNFRYISPAFRGLSFDPDNRYSVPYQWGTEGIVYRSDLTGREITSWTDLWDPQFRGKVGLWKGQGREAIGLTLKMLGYSANSENPAELEAAMAKLRELGPGVVFIESINAYTVIPGLMNERLFLAQGYAFDAVEGKRRKINIKFALPSEGAVLWGENFTIPSTTRDPAAAQGLLNYLLESEVMAKIANFNYFAVAHDGALPLIDAEIRSDPLVYPPEELLKEAEIVFQLRPEAEIRYRAAWDEFTAWVEAGARP
jgi:spermidine/putrescine transport system substrate-binding protein